MYDYLTNNVTIDNADKYQLNKIEWLESLKDQSVVSKRAYWTDLQTRVHEFELIKEKDLYEFTQIEIEDLIKYAASVRRQSVVRLFATINMYITYTVETGKNYVGNPCDRINLQEIININTVALKQTYQNLGDFYSYINNLEISNVDKAMLTLLRYGATIDQIVELRWEDIDKENMVLYTQDKKCNKITLPIDNMFLIVMENAKNCQEYVYLSSSDATAREEYITEYEDYGYIIKTTKKSKQEKLNKNNIYNRIKLISDRNEIDRISVADLRMARKYDLLFKEAQENGEVKMSDVKNTLITLEGSETPIRTNNLKNQFELLSDIKVIKFK